MQTIIKKTLTKFSADPMHYDRIPGIIVTTKGTIIVYWELRSGPNDWTCYAIGMRRSEDGGETWSPVQEIAVSEKGKEDNMLNNPVMIARQDGTVIFLWEEAYCRGFVQISTDDGKTFGKAVEITDQIAVFREKTGYKWDLFAFGPGHGIELKNGSIIVPMWYANGGKRPHHPSVASTIRSDDGGKTWMTGDLIGEGPKFKDPNETCVVQIDNGDVLLNIRHEGRRFFRAISITKDGLTGFSTPVFDEALPDPICFGSIAKSPAKYNGKTLIVFTNCATNPNKDNYFTRSRIKLTLRASFDNCKTWEKSRLLENVSGYSDLAFSPDGQWIYVFYEQDLDTELNSQPCRLTFAKLNMDWLTDAP